MSQLSFVAKRIKAIEANIGRQVETIKTLRNASHITTDAEKYLQAMRDDLAVSKQRLLSVHNA